MDKKIKLSHNEVDVKLFLEVLGVYAVLVFVLLGIYYLGPAITGFVAVEKQVNYTDDVNFAADEDSVFVWTLGNPGQLKSVKIDGTLIGNGSAKVYIEHEGARYLVLDNSKLVEKPSGLFGITGFVAREEAKEDIKTEIEGILNDEQRELFDLLVSDINLTRNNVEIELETEDGDVKKKVLGEATDTQSIMVDELSLGLEGSDEKIKIKIESEFEESTVGEDENDEGEEGEAPINETPIINETQTNETQLENETTIDETIINETIEKIISIDLKYGSNDVYDANNDGIETLNGIVDFKIDASFNWGVDESKLCTRYEVFSIENEESNFACYGNSDCCSLVGLESSREIWNESLYLSYGSLGSSESNIVFAQVLYANYSLTADEPYSDVAYSSWSNLTSEFIEGIEFEDACIESCVFDGNETSYNLVMEVENAELRINSIDYIIKEKVPNNAPQLAVKIENLTMTKNHERILELKSHFIDADGDGLIYRYSEVENISIIFENDAARIIPDENFTGTRLLFITASDSYDPVSSNVFKVEVVDMGIDILDVQKGDNITISFLTYGRGNLTVKAANGSYAEFFNDNLTTADDMEIIELRCGSFEIFDKSRLIETSGLKFILKNGSMFKMAELVQESVPLKSMLVEDYFCEDTSYLTAKVIGGNLAQEIKFGNYTIIADISDVVAGNTFEIRNKEDSKLAVFDSFGNIFIKGNLTENVTGVNDGNDFMIQNPDGTINMLITNPEGNMLMKGFLNENQSILVPGINSFVIEDSFGNIVAYVDANGGMLLKGVIEENVLFG